MFRIIRRKVDLEIRPLGSRGPTFRAEDVDEFEARDIMDRLREKVMEGCYEDKRLKEGTNFGSLPEAGAPPVHKPKFKTAV